MRIHFVSCLPANLKGHYSHYRFVRSSDPNWTYCDVLPYTRSKQDKWLNDMGLWHAEVSRIASEATPLWWLTPLSRVIAFHPIMFHDVLFARGIAEMCQNLSCDDLYLVGFPKRIKEYLSDFCPQLQLVEDGSAYNNNDTSSPTPSVQLKQLGKKFLQFFSLTIKVIKNTAAPFSHQKAKTLVFSFAQNSKAFAKAFENTGDHFFHGLFDDLPNFRSDDIHWLYLNNLMDWKSENQLRRIFKKKMIHASTVRDHITLRDVFFIFRNILKIRRSLKKIPLCNCPLTLEDMQSSHFTNDFSQAILKQTLFAELITYAVCKKLLNRLSVFSVVYPYEGKGVERALLKAISEQSYPICSIAYTHAIYNPGLLYMRFHHESLLGNLKPNLFACSGPRQSEWLNESCGFSKERLVMIGSGRHISLLPLEKSFIQRKQYLHVLVLIGLPHELSQLSNFIQQDPSLFEECHLTIRKYPYAWAEQDTFIENIRKLIPAVQVNNLPLEDQLKNCDVVMTASTSAGLEAMLSGRPIICVDLHGILDLNPFNGKGRLECIPFCQSPKELKESLTNIKLMEQIEYEKYISMQSKVAHQFFAPPMPQVIAGLFKGS